MRPVTSAEIVAHLGELGLATAVIGAPVPGAPITAVATDTQAGLGELAWSKRPGAATGFRGSLLICSAEAAEGLGEAMAGGVIVVSERPRLAMALVVGRFFAGLAADQPPVYADPATARQVDDGRAWVRNALVGRNVRIEPLAAVGCPGMGYERDDRGRLVPFPQLGRAVLEDDVHIAAQAWYSVARSATRSCGAAPRSARTSTSGTTPTSARTALSPGTPRSAAAPAWAAARWSGRAPPSPTAYGRGARRDRHGGHDPRDVGDGEVWAGNPGKRLR